LPLTDSVLRQIIELQLKKICKRMKSQYGADLEIDESVVDALVQRSHAIETGARAIESTISREILPKLSRQILELTLKSEVVRRAKISVDGSGQILVKVLTE
jgi:type VI secretion system protein VasG